MKAQPQEPGRRDEHAEDVQRVPVFIVFIAFPRYLIGAAMYHAARTREPVRLPIHDTHSLYRGWQLPGRS